VPRRGVERVEPDLRDADVAVELDAGVRHRREVAPAARGGGGERCRGSRWGPECTGGTHRLPVQQMYE
jgi:hypothetical protein